MPVSHAITGGVDVVHLREPGLAADALYELARDLREVCRGQARLIVHASSGCGPGREGRRSASRRARAPGDRRPSIVGHALTVGRSVHSVASAVAAAQAGADFVVLGTIFASRSHPETAPAGIGLVRATTASVSIPIIGIGGITAENAAAVIDAGADGVAVISSILAASDVETAARALKRAMTYAEPKDEARKR